MSCPRRPQSSGRPSDSSTRWKRRWGSRAVGHCSERGSTSPHFVPIEDRWRIGFPEWDRYGHGHPLIDDYPYTEGRWWDPYNQNVLKGDYPIIGQHTFLNITATSLALLEYRQVPTPTTPFESTERPDQEEFFGDPDQFFYTHFFKLSFDLFHGDAAFKPIDWRVKVTPIFNVNYLDVEELASSTPTCATGRRASAATWRWRNGSSRPSWPTSSPDYDFVSVRAGSQPFISDFRGFIFSRHQPRRAAVRHASWPTATSST